MIRYLAVLAAVAVVTACASGGRRTGTARPVHLSVTGARSVAALDREHVEQELVRSLLDSGCVTPVAPSALAEVDVVVHLERWAQEEEPGGVANFDPKLGRDVPGIRAVVRARWIIEARRGASVVARDAREREVSEVTTANWQRDPRPLARGRMYRDLGEIVERLACRAARPR